MIRHVVLFRFRPGLEPERQREFHAATAAFVKQIPAISAAQFGPNLRLQQEGFDYALLLDFVDATAFARYKAHPAHARFIEDHIRGRVDETVRVQLAV